MDASRPVAVARQDGPLVETGQLADERQFLAAVLRAGGGWMAVVHFFAAEGQHLMSEHSDRFDNGDEPPAEAREAFERMLRRLEPYRQDAVSLCPFEAELSGHRFALVPDPESEGLRLEPDGPVLPGNEDSG